jgi:2-hydroxy-3-keto-5-methylthiopentenyl-1-phosphate phosphatase
MQVSNGAIVCVLVDFDGTIAPDDPTDRVLDRFADPSWRDLEIAWQNGDSTSRDCLARQTALLRATPHALDEMVRTIRVDPGFPAFIEFCRHRGIEVKIVSDGFDRIVSAVLDGARLSVPFFANKLEWKGGDRWRLGLPHLQSRCRVSSANCKCSHTQWSPARAHVVIGDGRSDYCMSMRADYVIAKGSLADHCRESGRPYASYENFHDVTASLSAWLAGSKHVAVKMLGLSTPAAP